MERDRRQFLSGAGTLGAASLLLPTWVFAESLPTDIQLLRQADYEARRREWFYLYSDAPSAQGDLRLQKVTEAFGDPQVEQFALILRSRSGASILPAGHYRVAGESFDWYIQHTHEKRGKQFYRADFALLR